MHMALTFPIQILIHKREVVFEKQLRQNKRHFHECETKVSVNDHLHDLKIAKRPNRENTDFLPRHPLVPNENG